MALIAVIAFLVLSGLIVASAEPARRRRRRQAEQRQKQAEDKAKADAQAAEAKRAEAQQQQMEKQRRRKRLATREGFQSRFETLRARELVPLAALEATRDRALEGAQELNRRARGMLNALPGDGGSVWTKVAGVVVGLLWLSAFTIEILIDQHSFLGLSYGETLATLLAIIAALTFSAVGLVLSDLIGFTHVLPLPQEMRRLTRAVLVVDVLVVLGFLLSQLPPVMQYRSAPIAAKVERLEQNQKVFEETPGTDPRLKSSVANQLAAERQKLDTSHYADQRLGIGAALVEALTSWGAIWLGVLASSAVLTGAAARRRRKSEALKVQITKRERSFHAEVAALAEELEIPPRQLREILEDFEVETPEPPHAATEPLETDAEPPPPPPPPPSEREEPRRQQQSDPPADGWPAF
jgi:uncharacterized integral membrane protein